jgi:hypothetical protein
MTLANPKPRQVVPMDEKDVCVYTELAGQIPVSLRHDTTITEAWRTVLDDTRVLQVRLNGVAATTAERAPIITALECAIRQLLVRK